MCMCGAYVHPHNIKSRWQFEYYLKYRDLWYHPYQATVVFSKPKVWTLWKNTGNWNTCLGKLTSNSSRCNIMVDSDHIYISDSLWHPVSLLVVCAAQSMHVA